MKENHTTKLVILADLGTIRALRLHLPELPGQPHQGPDTIEELEIPQPPEDTDHLNRFPKGNAQRNQAGMGAGEAHNKALEKEKRIIQFIAEELKTLLEQEAETQWDFAAPPAINKRIVAALTDEIRARLITNNALDLTHSTLKDIEDRFFPQAEDTAH